MFNRWYPPFLILLCVLFKNIHTFIMWKLIMRLWYTPQPTALYINKLSPLRPIHTIQQKAGVTVLSWSNKSTVILDIPLGGIPVVIVTHRLTMETRILLCAPNPIITFICWPSFLKVTIAGHFKANREFCPNFGINLIKQRHCKQLIHQWNVHALWDIHNISLRTPHSFVCFLWWYQI